MPYAPESRPPESYAPPEVWDGGPEADKSALRVHTIIRQTEDVYKRYFARDDARNLAYWRGEFWKGDAHGVYGIEGEPSDYRAQQNEVFPAVDTITSALALDVPQVECIDARILSYAHVTRAEDATFTGRRIAAPMNLWAEQDDMDDTVAHLVLCACVFRRGGLVKTSWSPEHGRVIWRAKLPWQVFQDPTQPHIRDAAWVFERFPLHVDDLRGRIDEGVYEPPGKEIVPDQFPRDLIQDELPDQELLELSRAGLRDTVTMVEFWDFRRGRMYHFHPATRQILMATTAPWGNPYDQLLFSPALGQPRQVSTVDLLAPGQRDINELVSSRREMVERVVPRVGVDMRFFPDDDAWKEYLESSAVKPWRFKGLSGIDPASAFLVSPAPDTTFDYNKHLQEAVEHGRYAVGLGAMSRGQVENIRTAEEASSVRQNIEGRLNVRARRTIKIVRRMFDAGLGALRWAVRHPDASRLDLWRLHAMCVADVDLATWARELVYASVRFRVLPFSPLMEDRNARRASFERVLPVILGSPLFAQYDQAELARELQEGLGWRPSVLASPASAAASAASASAASASVPAAPAAPLGIPPDALLSALAGAAAAPSAPPASYP